MGWVLLALFFLGALLVVYTPTTWARISHLSGSIGATISPIILAVPVAKPHCLPPDLEELLNNKASYSAYKAMTVLLTGDVRADCFVSVLEVDGMAIWDLWKSNLFFAIVFVYSC